MAEWGTGRLIRKMLFGGNIMALHFLSYRSLGRFAAVQSLAKARHKMLAAGAASLLVLLSGCGGSDGSVAPNSGTDEPVSVAVKLAPLSLAQVSGAVFTTESVCNDTNKNIFATKPDVFLDGGPRKVGSAGLPPGDYYVKVTDPSGADLLGAMTQAQYVATPVRVDEFGKFEACYELDKIVTQPDGALGFKDTQNNGFEYKVWVSQDPTFPESRTKTDNFKVLKGVVNPPEFGKLTVVKFYDANANGVLDIDESEIVGWKVNISPLLDNTGDRFTPYTALVPVPPTSYTAFEYMPLEKNWYQTKPQLPPFELVAEFPLATQNAPVTLYFGNVCTGPGGGKTLGFWSNKNGQALFEKGDDLAVMKLLHLRSANGSDFDPASYAAFRTWILSANATNMANMLSAQLAAMRLNLLNGLVSGTRLLYAPGATSANGAGFVSVDELILEADAALAANGTTFSGSPDRSYQEALKNALDNGNNDRGFVQPQACLFTF
jgi:hypothetical protein